MWQDVLTIAFEVMPDPENTHTHTHTHASCPATSLVDNSDGSVDSSFAASEGCGADGIISMALQMFRAVNADCSVPSPGSVHSMTFRLQDTIQLVV